MFLREIKNKSGTYLNIIESYWEDKKPKHRSIASLGRLDKLQNTEQLRKIAEGLLKYCKEDKTRVDITTLKEIQRKIWGAPVVIKKIWDKFKLDELFAKLLNKRKIKFDFFSSVFLMVLDRITHPVSKLKSYEEQNRYWNIKENDLHHLYRALDMLQEEKDKIEDYLFNMNKSLFNMKHTCRLKSAQRSMKICQAGRLTYRVEWASCPLVGQASRLSPEVFSI